MAGRTLTECRTRPIPIHAGASDLPGRKDCAAIGYIIKLIFLSLPSVELALARIRARVAQGGHDIEEAVVRRRFGRGL